MPTDTVTIPRKVLDAIVAQINGLLAQTEPLPVPPAWPLLTNQSTVRVNLELPTSSTTCHVFADAMKQARPLGVDAAADARIVFVEQVAAQGDYQFYRNGNLEGIVNVPAGQSSLSIKPGAGTVKLIRPGCKYGDIFTPQFLAMLAPFGGVRFMDWGQTNGYEKAGVVYPNLIVNPSDIPTRDAETWAEPGKGVPPSVMVDLCNLTGKDGWFCIPPRATDETIQEYKTQIARLRPDVNCYIEYGNELWNSKGVFASGYNHTISQAITFQADPAKPLHEPDGSWNKFNAAHRWVARRTLEIKQILGDRFRVVLSNQHGYGATATAYGHWFKHQLKYINDKHGKPSDYLYAIASAPYGGLKDTDPKPLHRTAIKAIAVLYGLKYVAYECGQHNVGGGQATVDAHLAPTAGLATEALLNNYFASGLDEVFWFQMASRYGLKYVWGAANGMDTASPKYVALAKVAYYSMDDYPDAP